VVEHEQVLDADRLVGLAASWSYVQLRPDRDEVLAEVRRIATDHPELAGRATFPLSYEARCYRARRR